LQAYPAPASLNYSWNFGVLALFCLIIQLLTGIFLTMHYIPHVDYAFISVEHIMRDVVDGWLIRHLHANGATAFFVCLTVHQYRALYYGQPESSDSLGLAGNLMFAILIIIAFMGYVLPWGQMSYWGATVITNLLSVIPFGFGHCCLALIGWLCYWASYVKSFFKFTYCVTFCFSYFSSTSFCSFT